MTDFSGRDGRTATTATRDQRVGENPRAAAGAIETSEPPAGEDPLLWELSNLRQVATKAIQQNSKNRNHIATASFLRAANGLLDLVARIEKARAEELKAKQATTAVTDYAALKAEFNRHLDELAKRIEQAQAAAPKCPYCGQALPHGVNVGDEAQSRGARASTAEPPLCKRLKFDKARGTRAWPACRLERSLSYSPISKGPPLFSSASATADLRRS